MTEELRAALAEATPLLNSLGIAGPNIIHAEQGMHPDGKNSYDGAWDGPGWCVCRRVWPCEALRLSEVIAALLAENDAFRVDARLLGADNDRLLADNDRLRAALQETARVLNTLDGQALNPARDRLVKVTVEGWRDGVRPVLALARAALEGSPE